MDDSPKYYAPRSGLVNGVIYIIINGSDPCHFRSVACCFWLLHASVILDIYARGLDLCIMVHV